MARSIQAEFQHEFDVSIWNQGLFLPSRTTIDSLQDLARSYDFGIFIFMPEDVLEIRGVKQLTVRDNVLFECGLFFSSIGMSNCFFLVPDDVKDLRIPSDLWGIEPVKYHARKSDHSGVGAACTSIRKAIGQITEGGPTKLSLTGSWELSWRVPHSKHYKEERVSKTEVRHIGNRFLAKCVHRDIAFEVHGEVRDRRYITGTWGQTELYFGAFQMLILSANRIVGKSVGFRTDNKIAVGNWEWKRIQEDGAGNDASRRA